MPALVPIRFGSSPEGTPKRPLVAGITSGGGSGDPFWADVVLLMPFDGVNGSTGSPGMDDISSFAHGTANVNGAAQISTAQFEFAPSSLLTAPTDDFAFFTASPDWNLSPANSSPFTIEFWAYFNTFTAGRIMLGLSHVADGTFGFWLRTSGISELSFLWSPTGAFADIQTITSSGAGLFTGGQIPIALTKDSSGTFRFYTNGMMVGSATPANSIIHNPGAPAILSIGGAVAAGASVDGWEDELRITKAARYTGSSYVVATQPFPTGP